MKIKIAMQANWDEKCLTQMSIFLISTPNENYLVHVTRDLSEVSHLI